VVKHLTMALLAMVIYGALHVPLGRIPVANGAGWDGIDYVAMLEKGWKAGGPNTQLRPLIVWLARPAYLVTGSPAQAFDVTNYVGTSRVLGFTMIVAVVDVVLITAISTLGAFLYNLAAALLGGVEVTLAEDDR